jgi:hypothetical protein
MRSSTARVACVATFVNRVAGYSMIPLWMTRVVIQSGCVGLETIATRKHGHGHALQSRHAADRKELRAN